MKAVLCILLFLFFICIIPTSATQEVPISIDKSNTKIESNPVPVNQMTKLAVAVTNTNQSDISCVLKVYGEFNIMPSGEQNVTAYGGSYTGKNTVFTFYVSTNSTGTFPVKIELWYEGKQVDFFALDLVSEIEVSISKSAYYTSISPNSISFNQSATLTVAISNEDAYDIPCILRVYSQNATIFPSYEENVTAYGRGSYASEKVTSFEFYVKPNSTGTLPIKVELWYQGRQVDFHILSLEVFVPYEPTQYEMRLSWFYLVCIFLIVVVYSKLFVKNLETFSALLMVTGFFYILLIMFGLSTGEIYHSFSIAFSPSIGRIEVVIGFAGVFLVLSILALLTKKLEASLLLVNISAFLFTLPVFIDWLFVPAFASESLAGDLSWQAMKLIISAILGEILRRVVISKKKPQTSS